MNRHKNSPAVLDKNLYANVKLEAQKRFAVWPSAYGSMWLVQEYKRRGGRFAPRGRAGKESQADQGTRRWLRERWVNVCSNKPYKSCGRSRAHLQQSASAYPYCRPTYRVSSSTPVTWKEMSSNKLRKLCEHKHSTIRQSRRSNASNKSYRKNPTISRFDGSSARRKQHPINDARQIAVPEKVRQAAKLGVMLHRRGFLGGTPTGWKRGRQLAQDQYISTHDLQMMHAWFARHGPRAKTGGTSYPGYVKWLKDGSPSDPNAGTRSYRGAVAWLLWGGDPGMQWAERAFG